MKCKTEHATITKLAYRNITFRLIGEFNICSLTANIEKMLPTKNK